MAINKSAVAKESYPLLEVVQYLAALAVIVIHSGKLSSHEYLHFFIHSMVARIAVPFFFVTAGFLYRERTISLPAYHS